MPTGDMWGPGVPSTYPPRPNRGYDSHGVRLAKPIRRVFFWLFVWAIGLVVFAITATVISAVIIAAINFHSS